MKNMTPRQLKQYKEYQRVYRNAKAKERRLKNNHNVDVDMKLLTPTEWKKSTNKKREIDKLERFTDRSNKKYQYVSLGRESMKSSDYRRIANENQRLIENITYHKKKNLKKVADLNYIVYDSMNKKILTSDQAIEERISQLHKQTLRPERNRSMQQGIEAKLRRYNKHLKDRLKRMQENRYAQLQKENYIDKLQDWGRMFKGTRYESEYNKFLTEMKKLSPDDYERFYYLSDMGAIDSLKYISDSEVGTPSGQEKIYENMNAVKTSWEAVKKLLSM